MDSIEGIMDITGSDIILLAHASCGVLGSLAALWVFIEALNARPESAGRIKTAALVGAIAMGAAWILGGYWYVHFYPAEKAIILKGPWPFAHNIFMETKEHLFFITGLLSFYAICAMGAAAGVGIASIAFEDHYSWWLAGLAGALVGVVWNYAVSSVFTWRPK